jgi:hypothetical protein
MSPSGPENEPGIWGTPADELRSLEQGASPRFLLGVQNKIDRRRTTGQLVSFSWSLPKVILMEMVGWLSQIQELLGGTKGRTP